MAENCQASIHRRSGYCLPSLFFKKGSVRRSEFRHLHMPHDVLDDLQRFLLKIRPRVADLAIFLKVDIRELAYREIQRRLLWRLR